MKKIMSIGLIMLFLIPSASLAANYDTYIVKKNDSMWKIATAYQIGISEIINANKQVKNPDMIYPMQRLNIPNIDETKNVENEVVALVNNERAKRRLEGLEIDWELSRVARVKSCDMAKKGYFSHNSPTYGSPFTMMQNFGIKYTEAGENIASGQKSPAEVMQSWMNSTGHRENILKPSFTHIGVGYCPGGEYGHMWTQQFITK